jgi:hypothetical protein
VRRHDPDAEEMEAKTQAKGHALRLHAELARAERAEARFTALRTRVTGGLLVAVGLFLSWMTIGNLERGFYYLRSAQFAPVSVLVGMFLLVFGNGGASSLRQAPTWTRVGLGAVALIGLVWGATGFVRFLALFAQP